MADSRGRLYVVVDEGYTHRNGSFYVVLDYQCQSETTSRQQSREGRTKWGHKVEFKAGHASRIELTLWEYNKFCSDSVIGTAHIAVEDLLSRGTPHGYEDTVKIVKNLKDKGTLRVQISFRPVAAEHATTAARQVIYPPGYPTSQAQPLVIQQALHSPPSLVVPPANHAQPVIIVAGQQTAQQPRPPTVFVTAPAMPGGILSVPPLGFGFAGQSASGHDVNFSYHSQHSHAHGGSLHHHNTPVPAYSWNQTSTTSSYAPSAPGF